MSSWFELWNFTKFLPIEKILLFANLIEPKQKVEIIKDDPDDNKVIGCAVESSSDYREF